MIIKVIAISDHHPKMRRELTMSTHVETSGDKLRLVWKSKKNWNMKVLTFDASFPLRSQCDVPEQLLAEALLKKVCIQTKLF